jgi:hypothetical protein
MTGARSATRRTRASLARSARSARTLRVSSTESATIAPTSVTRTTTGVPMMDVMAWSGRAASSSVTAPWWRRSGIEAFSSEIRTTGRSESRNTVGQSSTHAQLLRKSRPLVSTGEDWAVFVPSEYRPEWTRQRQPALLPTRCVRSFGRLDRSHAARFVQAIERCLLCVESDVRIVLEHPPREVSGD